MSREQAELELLKTQTEFNRMRIEIRKMTETTVTLRQLLLAQRNTNVRLRKIADYTALNAKDLPADEKAKAVAAIEAHYTERMGELEKMIEEHKRMFVAEFKALDDFATDAKG